MEPRKRLMKRLLAPTFAQGACSRCTEFITPISWADDEAARDERLKAFDAHNAEAHEGKARMGTKIGPRNALGRFTGDD